jgi:glycosyltransferase involved in cell wall biosynthesis
MPASLITEPPTGPIAWDARLVAGSSTGDSTYWTGLLHGLAEVAASPKLLLISNQPRPEKIPWRAEWEWILLPTTRLGGRYWSYVQFPRLARRRGARVIHAQYALSPLVGRIGITTIHDVSFFIGPQWFGAKDRFLLQRSVPAAAKRAARVIAVSETSKGEIERFIPAASGKTRVTRLAAAPWIEPMERAAAVEVVRREFGEEGPYLLTVGTRWARKNQELAERAVMGLPESVPHRLLVVGKNPALSASARLRSLGYVSQEALSALYSAADAFLFPSFHEGFGIPVLEAMACGCPVICGSGGALPEVAGDAGRVVTSYDAADWTAAILEVVAEGGSSNLLRARGPGRAAEFSWRQTAEATLAVYREVTG